MTHCNIDAVPSSFTLAGWALRLTGPEIDEDWLVLPEGMTTIGAGQSCTLRLSQPGVRPLHCLITKGPFGMTVRRWADGTLLNGELFTEATLTPGDRLTVGPLELELAAPGENAAENFCAEEVSEQEAEGPTATNDISQDWNEETAETAGAKTHPLIDLVESRHAVTRASQHDRLRARKLVTELRSARNKQAKIENLHGEAVAQVAHLQGRLEQVEGERAAFEAQLADSLAEIESLRKDYRQTEEQASSSRVQFEREIAERDQLVAELRGELELQLQELRELAVVVESARQCVAPPPEKADRECQANEFGESAPTQAVDEAACDTEFNWREEVAVESKEPQLAPTSEYSGNGWGTAQDAPDEDLCGETAEAVEEAGVTIEAGSQETAESAGPFAYADSSETSEYEESPDDSGIETSKPNIEFVNKTDFSSGHEDLELSASLVDSFGQKPELSSPKFETSAAAEDSSATESQSLWDTDSPATQTEESRSDESAAAPVEDAPLATTAFDPPAESTEQAAKVEAPVSFIEQYRHLLDEDNQTPETESITPDQAPDPVANFSGMPGELGEGDESIEDYMAKMMARLRGGSEAEASQTLAAKSLAPVPVAANPGAVGQSSTDASLVSAESTADESKKPQAPLTSLDELKTGPAPEHARDMSALRALANSSAREAIKVSGVKRNRETAYTHLVVSTMAMGFGSYAVYASSGELGVILAGGLTVATAGGYWACRTVSGLILPRSVRAPKVSPKEVKLTKEPELPITEPAESVS